MSDETQDSVFHGEVPSQSSINESCTRSSSVREITSGVIQLFLIFAFLTFFFFTYVSKVEAEEFNTQVGIIVDNIIGQDLPTLITVSPELKQIVLDKLSAISTATPEDETQDKERIQKNDEILSSAEKTLMYAGIGVVVGIILVLYLNYCLNIKLELWNNVLIVAFIGLTEFTFLNLVPRNYISVDPNQVKVMLLQQVSQYAADKAKPKEQKSKSDQSGSESKTSEQILDDHKPVVSCIDNCNKTETGDGNIKCRSNCIVKAVTMVKGGKNDQKTQP
jgi:hypothetical protein